MNIFKFKLVIIGILIISLLVPVYMVSSLVDERKEREREVIQQMSKVWGKPKEIYGILLSDKNTCFIPSELIVTGNVIAESRKKGIFRIPFYTADLNIRAKFPH